MGVPDFLGDQRSGENTARVLYKDRHERVLARCQIELLIADFDDMSEEVECNSIMLIDRLFAGSLPAQQSAHSSEKFVHAEGLWKIIVSANVEPPDAILPTVSSAQNQDWLSKPTFTPVADQRDSVAVRQT